MNRNVKRVLLTSTVVLGISAMVPPEATAQIFRGRGASRNGCQPVCCTPMAHQASHYGNAGTNYGTASYASYQPSNCCESYTTNANSSELNQSTSQYPRESFDSQGNPISEDSQWNNQQRFDSQGNRIELGNQQNNQQRFDSQGNPIAAGNQWNNQPRFDSQGNRIAAGNQWNNQPRFDSQGNRIGSDNQQNSQQSVDSLGNRADVGNQLNNQQRLDSERNRIGADLRSNENNTRNDVNSDPSAVPGSTDANVEIPSSRDQ